MWGNCPLASSTQACILQLFQAYHSKSICGRVCRYSPNLSITRVTKAHFFSHKRITTARWSATSHLKSVIACLWDTTFPFERINHARSGMIHQASHQGLQHPLKHVFFFLYQSKLKQVSWHQLVQVSQQNGHQFGATCSTNWCHLPCFVFCKTKARMLAYK